MTHHQSASTVQPTGSDHLDGPQRLLYGIPEADLLSIGRSSMYRMVLDKRVQTVRLGGRRLIPHSELQQLVAQLLDEAAANPTPENV